MLVVLNLFAYIVRGQSHQSVPTFSHGIVVEGAIAIGPSASTYTYGIGGTFKTKLQLTHNLFAVADGGYLPLRYTADTKTLLRASGSNSVSAKYIPLKAGLRYYATDWVYFTGQAGTAIGVNTGANTMLTYTAGFGYLYPIEFGNSFDFGARYENWTGHGSTINFIGLHTGFDF